MVRNRETFSWEGPRDSNGKKQRNLQLRGTTGFNKSKEQRNLQLRGTMHFSKGKEQRNLQLRGTGSFSKGKPVVMKF